MKDLMFGVSGVRGIVGKQLTSKVAEKLGKAFGTYMQVEVKRRSLRARHLKIVVARDNRESGEELKAALITGLVSTGCNVIDMGKMATPVMLYNIEKTKSSGGVIITASHNPSEWNGVKFAGLRGMFLNSNEVEVVRLIYEKSKTEDRGQARPDTERVGKTEVKIISDSKGWQRHKVGILDSINRDAIIGREFKIAIDSPWYNSISTLLQDLSCKAIEVRSGRESEPLAEQLSCLSRAVISNNCDIGFATDADGDRLNIVTDKGIALDTEYILPLVADWVLRLRQGTVATNLSTSKMLEDVVVRRGSRLVRTKVGEINVVESMLSSSAVLGGEGNGGVIDPFIHYTRDAYVGICRILEYLAVSGESISKLFSMLPKYYMKKVKIKSKVADFQPQIKQVFKLFPNNTLNTEDGIRIDFERGSTSGWLHIRQSNTEPIARLIVETTDKRWTDSIISDVLKAIRSSKS
ncbi:MAG: hypothetical protein HY769_06435 [Candidatus Stahlbacteria bacterium]|nr:hypothetical protein [Candidatus Stahlbacteria bacterium]